MLSESRYMQLEKSSESRYIKLDVCSESRYIQADGLSEIRYTSKRDCKYPIAIYSIAKARSIHVAIQISSVCKCIH